MYKKIVLKISMHQNNNHTVKNVYLNHVHLWFVVVAVWLLADVFFDPGDGDGDAVCRFWLLLFNCAVLLTEDAAGTAVTTAVGRVTGFACLLGCFLICSSKAVRKNEIVVSWCLSCVSQFRFDFLGFIERFFNKSAIKLTQHNQTTWYWNVAATTEKKSEFG